MTIQEAKKLKWGTVVIPSQTAHRRLKEYRSGIFVGLSRDKNFIKVIPFGIRTVSQYAPVFWNAKPEVK